MQQRHELSPVSEEMEEDAETASNPQRHNQPSPQRDPPLSSAHEALPSAARQAPAEEQPDTFEDAQEPVHRARHDAAAAVAEEWGGEGEGGGGTQLMEMEVQCDPGDLLPDTEMQAEEVRKTWWKTQLRKSFTTL